MIIKTGVDLLPIHKIQNRIDEIKFMDETFHDVEKHSIDIHRLTSIYALKECVFKALDVNKRDWLDIEVSFSARGKPRIVIGPNIEPENLESFDCSVSHENGYILASVVMLIR